MPENLPPDDAAPTGDAPPPPPPQPSPRRVLRSRDDRVLTGVCGGIAASFGVDAVLVRITAVALTLFGGAGVLLYLLAAFFLPEEGTAGATAPATPRSDRNRVLTVLGVVALVVIGGPILGLAAGLVFPFAFLAVLGVGVAWLVTGRRPEREVGSLARATFVGLGILLLLGCLSVAAFWTAGLGGEAVIAGLVIAAGLAVFVAAFLRPARWLVLPALALAIPAGFVSAAGIDLTGGVGERAFRPLDATQIAERYELGVGGMTVDLRGAYLPAGDHELELDVGIGEAVLIVPEDVCVATRARVGAGLVELFDRENGGVDVDVEDLAEAKRDGARLVVDADIGLGHLDVRHTAAPYGDKQGFQARGPFDEDVDDDAPGNTACAGATS